MDLTIVKMILSGGNMGVVCYVLAWCTVPRIDKGVDRKCVE